MVPQNIQDSYSYRIVTLQNFGDISTTLSQLLFRHLRLSPIAVDQLEIKVKYPTSDERDGANLLQIRFVLTEEFLHVHVGQFRGQHRLHFVLRLSPAGRQEERDSLPHMTAQSLRRLSVLNKKIPMQIILITTETVLPPQEHPLSPLVPDAASHLCPFFVQFSSLLHVIRPYSSLWR